MAILLFCWHRISTSSAHLSLEISDTNIASLSSKIEFHLAMAVFVNGSAKPSRTVG
jgi:hypothetical protein